MWVIMTYDVGVKRNARVRKTCRKYLMHVQKSVFEGEISNSKLKKMKWEIASLILPEEDQVAIYTFETERYFSKDVIGYRITDDIII